MKRTPIRPELPGVYGCARMLSSSYRRTAGDGDLLGTALSDGCASTVVTHHRSARPGVPAGSNNGSACQTFADNPIWRSHSIGTSPLLRS